ncbi:Glycosyltransferase 61 catalytic domain-containing protein [Plasmodiophora brassicae]|uniref:Glycosyltransferase 61 catalytic domain-containing protein n=1 Tax=Plasmodiophora brassicae TaxID=37360 RepID=A0A0G4IV63_PLABS|nr:hypothetical protein PBRA_007168 [Plasmodiophora brassicae]SPQ98609.1 unnamed protein product [Plasmodiophora brassicae]
MSSCCCWALIVTSSVVAAWTSGADDGTRAKALLVQAIGKVDAGDVPGAVAGFSKLVDEHPDVVEGYVNLGAVLESVGKRDQARAVYELGLTRAPTVTLVEAPTGARFETLLCRFLMVDKQKRKLANPLHHAREELTKHNEGLQKWGIRSPVKDIDVMMAALRDPHPDDAVMADMCNRATATNDADWSSFVDLGKMQILVDDYADAITSLSRAKSLLRKQNDPALSARVKEVTMLLDDLFRSQYRLNTYRAEDADRALRYQRAAARNLPVARNIQNVGTIMLYSRPLDARARTYIDKAGRVRVDEVNKALPQSQRRRHVHRWEDIADDVAVLATAPEFGIAPGQVYRVRGTSDDQEYMALSYGDRIPVAFTERQLIVATLTNVTMEASTGVLYNDDAVFFGAHAHSTSDYTGGTLPDQQVVDVPGAVVSIDPSNKLNYYHWTTEGLAGIALTLHYYPDARIMLPDNVFAREALDLFDIDPGRVVWYDPKAPNRESPGAQRYRIETLMRVDWRDVPGGHVVGPVDDPWRIIQPAAAGIRLARRHLLSKVRHEARPKVIYVSRADAGYIRVVQDEERLLRALRAVVGPDCLHVFVAEPGKKPGVDTHESKTLLEQVALFASAELVIGPHGAGLSNIVFARDGCDLVYFPTNPMVDNCFAHLAAAVNARLHPVDAVTAYYFGPYHLDDAKIQAVVDTVTRVIQSRGWTIGGVCANSDVDVKEL